MITWFRRLPRHRRYVLILAVALVLLPFAVIADSYLIVRDVRPLARKAPTETRVMRDRRTDKRAVGPLRQRWVNLGAMSPHLVHAVVVHEDATFFEHRGFDEFEIRAALRRSWEERRMVRGASTITTQLARNLYLGTDRSLARKLREIPLTLRLEGALDKRRILELYLNFAEWGPGVFGAEAASRHHFGVAARNLSPARAALLAAALPSPRRSSPARPSPYLRRRAAIILTRMQARGWLGAQEMQAARQELGFPGQAPGESPKDLEAGLGEEEEAEVTTTVEVETAPVETEITPETEPGAETEPAAPDTLTLPAERLEPTTPEPSPGPDSPPEEGAGNP
jgi:monofunctional biosynthetic peptidoglycan transglycosylase